MARKRKPSAAVVDMTAARNRGSVDDVQARVQERNRHHDALQRAYASTGAFDQQLPEGMRDGDKDLEVAHYIEAADWPEYVKRRVRWVHGVGPQP